MAALDTNVLVRFIVKDDARQSLLARRLFERCIEEEQSLHVPVTVTIELEWVLRSSFGFEKEQVLDIFAQLLSTTELDFASEEAVELALAAYRESVADFADCLHLALSASAGQSPFWTFDKRAAKLDGGRQLV